MSIIEDADGIVRVVTRPCTPYENCWACGKPAAVNLTFDRETLAGTSMSLCKACHDDMQTTIGFVNVEGGPDV